VGRHKWVLLPVLLFVLINSVLISYNWYYLLFLPFVLLIGYLAIFSLDKLLFLTLFFVPLSYPLEKLVPGLGFNLQLPSEIMIILIMVVFLLKQLLEGSLDVRIIRHPVSIAIYLYLIWMFLTSVTSTMPLISMKYFISRAWFITVFYFFTIQLFQSKKGIRRYFWVYFISFFGIVLMAIGKMSSQGFFDQFSAQFSACPFFNDHTSYGAIIAMVLPFLACFLFYKKYSVSFRIFNAFLLLVVLLALVLSYTRAAWISVGLAFFVWLLLYWRVKLVYVLLLFSILFGVVYANHQQIVLSMEQNHQDSSKELQKHLKSIYNIRSDASNLERINRWKCALKMFEEKPVFGWGPGTYMFQYAPFQVSHDKTTISTNRGDWGNAHSEFFGALAESGFMGIFTFVLLLICVFYIAFTRYVRLSEKYATRLLLLGATLGLVTYCTHSFLNNFLDTDKASALFWGFIAMIVAIDVYHSGKEEFTPQS
jgi:putative inorganic carbon (hco3(-)) transporter